VGSYPNYSTHVIDLDRDSTRTLGLPAPGSSAQEGGNKPPAFSFSADSSRVITAQASSGFPRVFTSNSDGTGLQEVLVNQNNVERVGWLGSSSRFLVTGYDDATEGRVLAIVEESGSLSAPMRLRWPRSETRRWPLSLWSFQTHKWESSRGHPAVASLSMWKTTPISSSTPSSGFDPVVFSETGRDVLWMPHQDGGNADELYSASFDSMGAPAENIVAEMPMGTMPPISQFWLRR
jgi:hypothetical protein